MVSGGRWAAIFCWKGEGAIIDVRIAFRLNMRRMDLPIDEHSDEAEECSHL